MDQIEKNTVSAKNQLAPLKHIRFVNREGKGKRIMFAGNSITIHGIRPELGWHWEWGMAATCEENDYVHVVMNEVKKSDPDAAFCIAQVSRWEVNYAKENYQEKIELHKDARDFDADIIIMRAVENCPRDVYEEELFMKSYKALIDYLNKGNAKVILKTFEFDVPVQVIKRSNPEALKLPFKEFDYANGSWQTPGALQDDGGFMVYGSPNNYTEEQLEGLYAFDVVITPGHGWPSFTFGGDVEKGVYTASSCYMIGFTKDYIEFQRFNKGVRTMIYGNSHNPISSSAISNKDNVLYTYGERMSVVIGAIETDEGTRIVLNLNGVNRIDYLDKTAKRLPAKGWWAIYNPKTNGGNMMFYPYSGITVSE